MRMDEQITLLDTTTAPNARGIATKSTASSVTVWADKLSVNRTEHYKANAAGFKADIIFRINADDYSDQAVVQYKGITYDVVRSYAIGRGRIELTCSKR